jgi:predicted transcriptional regulator
MDYKERIREKGLLKSWIAKKIGISNVLFSYYLNGTRPMPEHVEIKLKEILS